jgi:hypothetical protein
VRYTRFSPVAVGERSGSTQLVGGTTGGGGGYAVEPGGHGPPSGYGLEHCPAITEKPAGHAAHELPGTFNVYPAGQMGLATSPQYTLVACPTSRPAQVAAVNSDALPVSSSVMVAVTLKQPVTGYGLPAGPVRRLAELPQVKVKVCGVPRALKASSGTTLATQSGAVMVSADEMSPADEMHERLPKDCATRAFLDTVAG